MLPAAAALHSLFHTGFSHGSDFFLASRWVGDGNEVAHIRLVIGSKSGPAGSAFCHALSNNKDGFTTLLAVVHNLPAKPDTILFNKVTIQGCEAGRADVRPAQAAVARAVVDSVETASFLATRRRPLPHGGRLHSLGSERRQEDLRLQLSATRNRSSGHLPAAVSQRRDCWFEDGQASFSPK